MNTGKKKRVEILIVEDSQTQAAQTQFILEQKGFHVTTVFNGKEALGSLKKKIPTIIISDIIMPEMDGYQLCEQIRKCDETKDIPVILLTSLSKPEDVIKGLQCGANNFIVKPYDKNHLLARIQYILANMELRNSSIAKMGLEILFSGKKYFITSDRIQIVDLLLSTYDTAVQKARELEDANIKLKSLKEQLLTTNKELEQAYTQMRDKKNQLGTLLYSDEIGFLIDDNGRILGITEKVLETTGRSRFELIENNIIDILDTDSVAEMKNAIQQMKIVPSFQATINVVYKKKESKPHTAKLYRMNMGEKRLLLVNMTYLDVDEKDMFENIR